MTRIATGSMGLKRKALELSQPLSAHLELTYRCHWRCAFCYNPRHADIQGLSGAEWVVVLDGLRALGTLSVTLTGGEPMLHRGFFDVASAVRERAFALRIFTTGSLVTPKSAERIAALQPLGVELSLHGASAAVHDGTTGKPGSFEAFRRGLDALLSQGVPVLLKTPLTRLNEGELDSMIALTRSLGLPYQVDPNLTPRDDGDRSPLELSASREAIGKLVRIPGIRTPFGQEPREKGGVNCGLGRITLAIDPEGNVYPCPEWRHQALGNVRRASVVDLWRESEVRREAANVARDANDRIVEAGGPMASFPFCPALAFQAAGDASTPDPGTLARMSLVTELRRSA